MKVSLAIRVFRHGSQSYWLDFPRSISKITYIQLYSSAGEQALGEFPGGGRRVAGRTSLPAPTHRAHFTAGQPFKVHLEPSSPNVGRNRRGQL